jgi:hypothetical protein
VTDQTGEVKHCALCYAKSAIINCTPVDVNSNPAPKRFARQTCKLQTRSFDHMTLINYGYVCNGPAFGLYFEGMLGCVLLLIFFGSVVRLD